VVAPVSAAHHVVLLASGWGHMPATECTAYASEPEGRPSAMVGRAVVTFDCGGFELRLNPTPRDLRALATALNMVADDQEAINAGPAQPESPAPIPTGEAADSDFGAFQAAAEGAAS
jgi:hypothetical protein